MLRERWYPGPGGKGFEDGTRRLTFVGKGWSRYAAFGDASREPDGVKLGGWRRRRGGGGGGGMGGGGGEQADQSDKRGRREREGEQRSKQRQREGERGVIREIDNEETCSADPHIPYS